MKNNPGVRSHFHIQAVDWVDKYFQIGSAYYFTQKRLWKANWLHKGILFAASKLVCILRFTATIQEFRTTHHGPSLLILSRVINIFVTDIVYRNNSHCWLLDNLAWGLCFGIVTFVFNEHLRHRNIKILLLTCFFEPDCLSLWQLIVCREKKIKSSNQKLVCDNVFSTGCLLIALWYSGLIR